MLHRKLRKNVLYPLSKLLQCFGLFRTEVPYSSAHYLRPEDVRPIKTELLQSQINSQPARKRNSTVTVNWDRRISVVNAAQLMLTRFAATVYRCRLPLVLLRWPGLLVAAEQVALVEVFLERPGVSALLQGEVVESGRGSRSSEHRDEELEGELVLVQNEEKQVSAGKGEDDTKEQEPWIGVVPVEMDDSKASTGNQESFTDAMVNKMKRALVLGASALIILALNQNTVSEMDLSQVLSKPIIVIQTSENVTKLIGALLRGLQATAKITYKTILQDNLGATLTLWSSCGRSRGGRYGEWQGVICTGETNSQVQKYLQQLWDTVLLVALILSTGVIVQARWQYQDHQLNDDLELFPKQDVLKRMSSLKTKTYRQPKPWCDPSQPAETDNCAVCLEPFNNNQCLRVLPCLHEYHRECVDPWLLLHHTCPLCKRSILGSVCRDS